MIEPNMATLITMMFTDAEIDKASLDQIFRRVIDKLLIAFLLTQIHRLAILQ